MMDNKAKLVITLVERQMSIVKSDRALDHEVASPFNSGWRLGYGRACSDWLKTLTEIIDELS